MLPIMKTRRFIILSILSVTVSLQTTSAQSNSNREYYDKAYSEITDRNILESVSNPELMATVYALGRVNMVLTNRAKGTVKIVNDSATDYDWNIGGGTKRDSFIRTNNFLFGIDPKIHGFKTYYYGVGTLRR